MQSGKGGIKPDELFHRYPTTAAPPEPEEAEKPRITAVDLEQEIERLREEELITAEEAQWLKAVYLKFGLLPHEVLKYSEKGLGERREVLKKARIDIVRLRERWLKDQGLDPENNGKRLPLPPPVKAGEYIAEDAVALKLIEPVVVRLGEMSEYGLKIKRRLFFKEDLHQIVYALTAAGEPHYAALQLFNPILASLKKRAVQVDRVNPLELINLANGVLDLETLSFMEDCDALFTYEEKPVNPTFIERLRRGEITEEYFVGQAFYQVLRKHYSPKEWEKLKAVLGATIMPRTLKLIAIIVGEPNTRKTVLFNLLCKALGGLAAVVRLRQIQENRFSLQHALGARVLLTSEEAQTIVYNVDLLKSISGGDPLYVDRKHLPSVTLKDNPLKVIIFTNAIPVFKRIDAALVDRIVIIEAENSKEPDPEEQALIEKALKKPEEFFEFILWCYWQLKQNNFKIPEKGDPIYYEVLLEAQSNVSKFLRELESGLELEGAHYSVHFSPGLKTRAAHLYDVYLKWCYERKERAVGRNTFYSLVEREWEKEGVSKTKPDSEGVAFLGVYLKEKRQEPEVPYL